MVLASCAGEAVAAALFFEGGDTLYGRYWGCLAEFDYLHFEACYYRGIEYCIDAGLSRFDPGAQGEHKIQRGFEPVLTYSNHWIVDERSAMPLHSLRRKNVIMCGRIRRRQQRCCPLNLTVSSAFTEAHRAKTPTALLETERRCSNNPHR